MACLYGEQVEYFKPKKWSKILWRCPFKCLLRHYYALPQNLICLLHHHYARPLHLICLMYPLYALQLKCLLHRYYAPPHNLICLLHQHYARPHHLICLLRRYCDRPHHLICLLCRYYDRPHHLTEYVSCITLLTFGTSLLDVMWFGMSYQHYRLELKFHVC